MSKTSLGTVLSSNSPIVVEGPDGSGKSTLIESVFPGAIHSGGPCKNHAELMRRLYAPTPGCVYDRWSGVSELVYGEVFRGLMLPAERFVEAMRIVRPVIIYCRPPEHVLDRNLLLQKEKGHKPAEFIAKVIANTQAIRDRYDTIIDLARNNGCTVLEYDYTNGEKPECSTDGERP